MQDDGDARHDSAAEHGATEVVVPHVRDGAEELLRSEIHEDWERGSAEDAELGSGDFFGDGVVRVEAVVAAVAGGAVRIAVAVDAGEEAVDREVVE